MKHIYKLFTYTLIAFLLLNTSTTYAESDKKDKKEDKKEEKKEEKSHEEKAKEAYDKLIKGASTVEGLFTTHFKDNKLYFEIDTTIQKQTYLLSNRMASTTDTRDFVAGQMITDPFMIRFTVDTNRVVMFRVQNEYIIDENDPIKKSFDKNIADPILKTFKIAATNDNKVIIDVTDFFGTNEKCISPLRYSSPLVALFGGQSAIKGSFVKEDSYITSLKNFPKNIEIKSLMNFKRDGNSQNYTVNVHRTLMLLPEVPMTHRYHDDRIGFFTNAYTQFSSEIDGSRYLQYITRWRLEPRAEDMDKYFAGELVEPANPIIFYVDSAFPEKWRATVLQGIEDWQPAFEAAGFKNAIQARMYPTKEEDPNFDPDDMRYNCVKYATTKIANAMGPSFTDPRSGEILVGDVIWYHDVVSLIHNWRFVQTAAVDPRVRKTVFDDEVMNESLRYVTSHEIGHTLGLAHNMGASFSYPVDSLRSPSFTQKYGTTPSIMDYARNNYVAQPGDKEKGVRLTPPLLGVYDMHAINWGYRLFAESTPLSERKDLDAIIAAKADNDMYRFGYQQIFGDVDYTDLTEDLGDDHIKASDYCISNLKIILNNLEQWHAKEGASYLDIETMYKEVIDQYKRVIFHVLTNIGGVDYKVVRQGDPADEKSIRYTDKEFNKKTMLWIVNQAKTCLDWLTPNYVYTRFTGEGVLGNYNDKLPLTLTAGLFDRAAMGRLHLYHSKIDSENGYSMEEYYDDVLNAIFAETLSRNSLNSVEMNMQNVALDKLIYLSGIIHPADRGKKKLTISQEAEALLAEYKADLAHSTVACSHAACISARAKAAAATAATANTDAGVDSYIRINLGQFAPPEVLTKPIAYEKIKWIQKLYKSRLKSADKATQRFYEMQLVDIDQVLSEWSTFNK